MLRPRLVNSEAQYDDLNLSAAVRKQLMLRSSQAAGAAGDPPFIFVDADELPDAVRPAGVYEVEGGKVRLRLVLGRGEQAYEIVGKTDDLDALAELVVEVLLESLQKVSGEEPGAGGPAAPRKPLPAPNQHSHYVKRPLPGDRGAPPRDCPPDAS